MPTRDTAWPAGTPCWVDYGASDLPAARSFYADLLGWTFSGGEAEYGGYLLCERNGRAAAGMVAAMDGSQTPSWTTYFASDDAAATAEKITAAGGAVPVPPMQVGPMGTMAIAADPQGNGFGVWQAGVNTGVQVFNEPGSLVWNDAAVADVEAAQTFYGAVFGFRFDAMEGMEGYATFAVGEEPVGGLGAADRGAPSGWATCFAVASADEAAATTEAAGGKVVQPPTDTSFGRFAVLEDPWGASFSVMQDTSS